MQSSSLIVSNNQGRVLTDSECAGRESARSTFTADVKLSSVPKKKVAPSILWPWRNDDRAKPWTWSSIQRQLLATPGHTFQDNGYTMTCLLCLPEKLLRSQLFSKKHFLHILKIQYMYWKCTEGKNVAGWLTLALWSYSDDTDSSYSWWSRRSPSNQTAAKLFIYLLHQR